MTATEARFGLNRMTISPIRGMLAPTYRNITCPQHDRHQNR